MTSDELAWIGGYEAAKAIRHRQISPVEIVEHVLARLGAVEPLINAFVTVTAEEARIQAREAEAALMNSDAESLPPLFGVPVTVKDLTDTAGVRTTYGSRAFADHVPAHDGINWARIKAAGAILIGKTTTPEFGGLGVTESGLTGVTNNPWLLNHTAGGSSGGAASSVAAGVAALAWGSDGGGSIRVPASCCGVVGLKASRGRFPVDRAWESVGTEGPLTRTVIDSALMLSVASGPDPRDPLALPYTSDDFIGAVLGHCGLAGKRIAFAPAPANSNVDVEVAAVVRKAVEKMSIDGRAEVAEVTLELPDPIRYFEDFWSPGFVDLATDSMMEIVPSNDAEVTEHPVMLEFAEYGRRISAVQYRHTATVVRGEITAGYNRIFEAADLIVTPTMPVTAFPHPGKIGGIASVNGILVDRPAIDFHRLTESPSHAGLPAITVPCGFSSDGLPVGLQIVGPLYADAAVLAAAAAFEQIAPWTGLRPAFRPKLEVLPDGRGNVSPRQ